VPALGQIGSPEHHGDPEQHAEGEGDPQQQGTQPGRSWYEIAGQAHRAGDGKDATDAP
jgi:hypothetical protein